MLKDRFVRIPEKPHLVQPQESFWSSFLDGSEDMRLQRHRTRDEKSISARAAPSALGDQRFLSYKRTVMEGRLIAPLKMNRIQPRLSALPAPAPLCIWSH